MHAVTDAYYQLQPRVAHAAEQVSFGTSGHRGRSLQRTFNEWHLLAIAQAVADYRQQHGIHGPLYLGLDTHALSRPAWETCLRVLVANKVDVRIAANQQVTATPLISRAILAHNLESPEMQQQADGLVITPSHNPPEDGGIKYNTPDGGPADTAVTQWIEERANRYLAESITSVKSTATLEEALAQVKEYDYIGAYIQHLARVINLPAIKAANLRLGVDPMGGTALPIWQALQQSGLNLEIVNEQIDSRFAFMPPDHDGKIRMDCSSPAAMANLLKQQARFDLALANDPDADRHGVVDGAGLMNPNHFLCVAVDYLLQHRPQWSADLAIGKTLVTSSMMDKVVAAHQRQLYEVPVGFKWFVEGLFNRQLAFAGEESAGASFLTLEGQPWSTDKDGIILCLLAAEITAVTGLTPSAYYAKLTAEHGTPFYQRVDAAATHEQKAAFKKLTAQSITSNQLAGDSIVAVMTQAPSNQADIGGVKVVTAKGWFAARPSGTEAIYKIYAESFTSPEHLQQLISEAQALLNQVLV